MSIRPMLASLLVFAAASAAPASAVAASARAVPTAVIAYGDAAAEIEPLLRQEGARLASVALQPASTTKAEVATARELGVACGADSVECLVKLAVLLKVERLVVAAGVRQPEGILLDLFLVDAALARETGRVQARVSKGVDRRDAVRDALELLVEPDRHFGALVVVVPEPGAVLLVDGQARSEAPHPRVRLQLRAGEHDIEVRRAGRETFRQRAVVKAGDEAVLEVALVPVEVPADVVLEGAPPEQPPEVGGTPPLLTAGTVAAVAGVATLAAAGGTALALDGLLTFSDVGNRQERIGMLQAERALAVVALVGGVVAVGGGALAATALVE